MNLSYEIIIYMLCISILDCCQIFNLLHLQYFMKLSIDDDQERPEALTQHLFVMLMAAEIKRKGVFQIMSFTRKREKVYSTKLSDGFFVIKAMIVSEAANQIEKGLIKIYSILEGMIRNHGDNVIVVKQTMRHWDYDCAVGDTKVWKPKKQNVNSKGSSLIFWDRNPLKSLAAFNQHQDNRLKQAGNLQKNEKTAKNYTHLLSSQKRKSTLRLCEGDQVAIAEQVVQKQLTEMQIKESKEQVPSQMQTQSMERFNKQEKEQQIPSAMQPSKKSKLDEIMQLIMSDQQDQVQQNENGLTAAQVQIKYNSAKRKSQKKIDLKFIFYHLDEQNTQNNEDSTFSRLQTKYIQIQKVDDHDQEDSFMVWMQNKSKLKEASKAEQCDKKVVQEQKSKRIQQYLELQSQLPNLDEEKQEEPRIKFQQQQQSEFYPSDKRIPLLDIFNGRLTRQTTFYWWTRITIICLNYINQKENSLQTIISDQSKTFLMNSVFKNITDSQVQLKQGCQYRVTKGAIRYMIQETHNGCSQRLEFDCKQCHILQEEGTYNCEEKSTNYFPISKIQMAGEGILINVFGVLKSVKNLKAKKDSTFNYEIVDPLSKWSISLVHFQSDFSSQYIKNSVHKGITAYGVQVGSFKGKKNLTVRPSSIIKFQWLPYTRQAIQIHNWIDEGNNILQVETELLGFVTIIGLRNIEEQKCNNIHITNVTVMEFNDKITYRACIKCFKKIEEGKCRSCGQRRPDQIIDRIFLRGSLGDWSATIKVIWLQALADLMLAKGFQAMQQNWLLRHVQLWIEKGNNGTLTVIRMRKNISKKRLPNLLSFIQKHTI